MAEIGETRSSMRWLIDVIETSSPGVIGVGYITLSSAKDLTAVAVGVVTIICTILVTRHNLNKQ